MFMIKGRYRDVQTGPYGKVDDRGWCPNSIVRDCNRLMAALMKRQEGMQGILYLAVGEGEKIWDDSLPGPSADASKLSHEWIRQAVQPEQIVFIDANGQPTDMPSEHLEITVTLNGATLVTGGVKSLREFGLFGGDATEKPDSGYLINYVIHPRIDFMPKATLTRQMRLHFGIVPLFSTAAPKYRGKDGTVPAITLSNASVKNIDGVGDAYAEVLAGVGITTIGALAEAELDTINIDIPPAKLVALQAKSVLALNTAANISIVQAFVRYKVGSIATSSTETLMSETGASEELIAIVRSQAAALQLALDDDFLERVTLDELIQPL